MCTREVVVVGWQPLMLYGQSSLSPSQSLVERNQLSFTTKSLIGEWGRYRRPSVIAAGLSYNPEYLCNMDGWILKKDLTAAESAAITAKSG